MSYDMEDLPSNYNPKYNPPAKPRLSPRDLEVLVTCIEIAALDLTKRPGDTFTEKRLFKLAQDIWGDAPPLSEEDLRMTARGMKIFSGPRSQMVLK